VLQAWPQDLSQDRIASLKSANVGGIMHAVSTLSVPCFHTGYRHPGFNWYMRAVIPRCGVDLATLLQATIARILERFRVVSQKNRLLLMA
jgi:ABC-type thiamin/hydroxymethylpyrimidine transport system permease subunit